jgi:hypothetical protein
MQKLKEPRGPGKEDDDMSMIKQHVETTDALTLADIQQGNSSNSIGNDHVADSTNTAKKVCINKRIKAN